MYSLEFALVCYDGLSGEGCTVLSLLWCAMMACRGKDVQS